MNLSLEQRLTAEGVAYTRLQKRDKVKLLGRWCKTFPELVTSARAQQRVSVVALDVGADQALNELTTDQYYLLPDDASGMSALACVAARLPDLTDLVSDVDTKCEEIVIVDAEFQWSAVLVNHGSPLRVGRHFLRR